MSTLFNTTERSRDPELELLLGLCAHNTKLYCQTFHHNLFTSPFNSLHDEIFAAIDRPGKFHPKAKKTDVAAPRGLGKTTIARARACKAILYRETPFIVYISASSTVAEMQTENIKRELLTNQAIRHLFGSIKISKDPDMDESFSKLAWTAFGEVFILPRGPGQQVRGLNWNGHRPGLYIIDDLENKDEIKNDEIRDSLKNWFLSDVLKSIDRYSKEHEFLYIDTIKHEDSVLQMCQDDPEWDSVRLSVCTEDFKSLAPDFMSDAEILAEVNSHREKGKMSVFYMEMMNLPVGGETQKFKTEYFKYYDHSSVIGKHNIEWVVITDPAKTVSEDADDSAIVGVGFDLEANRIYVGDIVRGKFFPDQLYDEIFAMSFRLGAKVLGVKVTSLNEFITQPLRNEMIRRGIFLEMVELKERGGRNAESKDERIFSMVPYYRQGLVYHNQTCCAGLEAQLVAMPRTKLKDIADALAEFVHMMDIGERYFGKLRENDMPPEDEFLELRNSYEKPLEDWRRL